MKKITEKLISQTIASLCIKANLNLSSDALSALQKAARSETFERARTILNQLIENAKIASAQRVPICQDTGLPVVFVEIGKDADIAGLDISKAIDRGIETGYRDGYLRNSIVREPLRRGASKFSPSVIHYDLVSGRGIKFTVLPKGFGSENKTKLLMFDPTASLDEIKDFIVASVKDAGPDACPPYIVGVGIGGTADYACVLAKKSLLKPIGSVNYRPSSDVHRLQKVLFNEINKLNIGPMGLGGDTTCLGVNILTHPTHIAGLPVCVNISCHVLRSASATI